MSGFCHWHLGQANDDVPMVAPSKEEAVAQVKQEIHARTVARLAQLEVKVKKEEVDDVLEGVACLFVGGGDDGVLSASTPVVV